MRRPKGPPRSGAGRLLAWHREIGALCAVCGIALMGTAVLARTDTLPLGAHSRNEQRLLADPALALRAAREARSADQIHRAAWLLGEVAIRHPLVADYADLDRARLLLEAGQTEAAAEAGQAAMETHLDSPLQASFARLVGDTRAQLGDEKGARQAWRAALDASRNEDQEAALLLAIATSHERSGEAKEAGETYISLWASHPISDEAELATERIEALEKRTGRSLRDASAWRKRADRLFRKRRNEACLEAYDRALALGLSRPQAARAGKQRAHTFFRLRQYPDAVEAFSALDKSAENRLWRARSLARAGRVLESIQEFEQLAEEARGELGLRAKYLAALLLDGRSLHERAKRHFQAVATSRGGTGLQNAARWHLGWGAYRLGRYDEALAAMDLLLEHEKDPIGRLRARYWRTRILERTDPASPRIAVEFRAIAKEFPLSYYGWRALGRLGDEASAAAVPVEIKTGKRALDSTALKRVRILVRAGLLEEAQTELSRLAPRARGVADHLDLARLYSDVGEFHRAQRLMVDAYTETLARGPVSNFEELWWYAWPSAFATLVRNATAGSEWVEPGLVFSIMREESGYRAGIVSPNGARGLLQIMIPTGERLARTTGLAPFEADDLFEPSTNIDLGSYYLGELRARFDGRLSATIASYNAGPTAVAGWVKEEADLDDDEWVEAIPYDQTRGYVKRVLRSLHAYRVLY